MLNNKRKEAELKIVERLVACLTSGKGTAKEVAEVHQALRAFTQMQMADGPSAGAHDIVDPGPPTTNGPPVKSVTTINGTGYIEATGADESQNPISAVIARIFRRGDLIADPDPGTDPTIADKRYQKGKPVFPGYYYQFFNSDGCMIPGALSGGSSDNVLMVWAQFQGDSTGTWYPARSQRQFVGVDPPSGGGAGGSGGFTPPNIGPPH